MLHPNHRPCARHADRPGEDPDGFRAVGMAPIRRHRPVPEPADVTVQPDTIPVDHEVTLPCPECDNRRDRLHPDVAVAAALLALLFIWGIAREVRLSRRK